MKHVSEVMFEYFDKLQTELTNSGLVNEADKLKTIKDQIMLKRSGMQLVHLRAYLNTYDAVPFFEEDMYLPNYKEGETIKIENHNFVILELENHNGMTFPNSEAKALIKMLVRKDV